MRARYFRPLLTGMLFVAMPTQAHAAPPCVKPEANNFVVASAKGDLTTAGWGGIWLLRSVDTNEQIYLKHCSSKPADTCYFATDVKPGRYYFQQAIPEGKNDLDYPVSTAALWFSITGEGVDYIGHWQVLRQGRVVSDLKVSYEIGTLDEILELCQIKDKPQYLDRIKSPAVEIVE
jgi:hypothetical protein